MILERKKDVAIRHGITLELLTRYEEAGVLSAIPTDDHVAYDHIGCLRVAVIAKAESLGFTVDEIVTLIEQGMRA